MNHESLNNNTNSNSNNFQDQQLFILNRCKFDPVNFNCLIQSNMNGQIEMIANRDLLPNEEIICWFSEIYLKNIKSKIVLFFIII
jgi:hypothetical protein